MVLQDSMDHILVGCAVVAKVWSHILSWINLPNCIPRGQSVFDGWWLQPRKLVRKNHRKGFDSFVILVAWMVSKECNK